MHWYDILSVTNEMLIHLLIKQNLKIMSYIFIVQFHTLIGTQEYGIYTVSFLVPITSFTVSLRLWMCNEEVIVYAQANKFNHFDSRVTNGPRPASVYVWRLLHLTRVPWLESHYRKKTKQKTHIQGCLSLWVVKMSFKVLLHTVWIEWTRCKQIIND